VCRIEIVTRFDAFETARFNSAPVHRSTRSMASGDPQCDQLPCSRDEGHIFPWPIVPLVTNAYSRAALWFAMKLQEFL
jgi:hypothetical protein